MTEEPRLVWKAFHAAGGHFEIEEGDSVLEALVLPSAELANDFRESARPKLARCVGEEGLTGFILRLWINPARRSRGLGKRFVTMALDKFVELGARAAVLRAIPSKTEDLGRLLKFYEGFGFRAEPVCQDVAEPYLTMGLLLSTRSAP